MPFSREKNRRIYITALVISFLLIIGSIYLHLKQKTHLGRMSFNLDRDRVKPTGGVEATTLPNDDESILFTQINESSNSDDYIEEEQAKSLEVSPPPYTSRSNESADYMQQKSTELSSEDSNEEDINTMDTNDEIIEDFPEDIDLNTEYDVESLGQDTSVCLRCLCMTVNGCRPSFCGSGNPCGLYRISKKYWIDAGKPTIEGGTTDNEDQDYLTCVNEDTCATTSIRQYYDRYKKHCSKTGTFDCTDQIILHLLGPRDCLTNSLSNIHAKRMMDCLSESKLVQLEAFYSDEY